MIAKSTSGKSTDTTLKNLMQLKKERVKKETWWPHTQEPMAWQMQNCESPKRCLIVSMISLALDDAVQKAVLRSPLKMFHKDVSVRKEISNKSKRPSKTTKICTEIRNSNTSSLRYKLLLQLAHCFMNPIEVFSLCGRLNWTAHLQILQPTSNVCNNLTG